MHAIMFTGQPIDDRRRTPRVALGNLVAELDFKDGSDPVLVCIWDLSLGGACLMVPPDLKIPKAFDLCIDGLHHPVEKIWQSWSRVGVRLRLDTSAAVEPCCLRVSRTFEVIDGGKDP
jgi:hypothetical protein